jgi:hypothetical protein
MNSWAQVAIPPLDKKFAFPNLQIFDTATQNVKELEKKALYRMYV